MCEIADNRPAQKRQANSRHSRQSACTKTAPQVGGKLPLSLAEILPSNSGLITDVHLTTTTATVTPTTPQKSTIEVVVVPGSKCNVGPERANHRGCLTVRRARIGAPTGTGSDSRPRATDTDPLIFPADFLPEERQIAATELAALPAERAQLILDEVAGRSRKQRSVHTRVGLVRSLAQAERNGHFQPGYAWEVREARRRALQREAERRPHGAQDQGIVRELPHHAAPCGDGKSGYEAFKAFTARWPRSMARRIPDHDQREDIE
jgi:hypothetical protein